MRDFEKLIAEFETSYKIFLSLAMNYPSNLQTMSGVCGEWSAHEVLAHLAGWLLEAKRRFPRYALGTSDIDYNRDAFNAVSIRMRREKSYEAIVEEITGLVDELAAMAGVIPHSQVEKEGRYTEWLVSLIHEAKEHHLQLEAFLKEKSF
jgi:hypothetical protein